MNEALLELADHDEALVRARHALEHPPSAPGLAEATEELRALGTKKRELDAEREPLVAEAAALERDATRARERAAAIAARLAEATGAGRELEAMAHERDALLARADDLEDALLVVLERLEPLDARDDGLRAGAQALAERRASLEHAVARERDEAGAAIAALEAGRPAVAGAVEPSVLARYEAIATRRGGVGAARLLDGRCQACHVTVPSAVADHVAHAPDGEVTAVCDECGRLLVR